MAWPKGKPRKPAEAVGADNEPESLEGNVTERDAWFYHSDLPPRLFKAGEVVPDGWEDSPAKIPDFSWVLDGELGTWSKKDK